MSKCSECERETETIGHLCLSCAVQLLEVYMRTFGGRCPHKDRNDGTCAHYRNPTPECTPWACPFKDE